MTTPHAANRSVEVAAAERRLAQLLSRPMTLAEPLLWAAGPRVITLALDAADDADCAGRAARVAARLCVVLATECLRTEWHCDQPPSPEQLVTIGQLAVAARPVWSGAPAVVRSVLGEQVPPEVRNGERDPAALA
jgi:hypothetical protein